MGELKVTTPTARCNVNYLLQHLIEILLVLNSESH
ncbi:hypothetical protein AAZX31_05G101300 [Glycine max]